MQNAAPQDISRFARNIPRYFIYAALKGFGFGLFSAIWVIYLQEKRGLTLAEAALVDVTFFIVAAFGEVPTGIVADQIGRKASVAIGAILMTVGAVGWAFAPTLPLIIVAYVALGIGFTFTSGAEDALFYESLRLAGRGDDYDKLVGRTMAIFPGALAAGSLIGGLLAGIDLIAPYIASGIVLTLATCVVFTLTEPRTNGGEQKQHIGFKTILAQSLKLMRRTPTLRYAMLYLALVPLAPFMIEVLFLQPQAVKLGVPVTGIGFVVMATQLTGMAGGIWSNRLKTRIGEARLLYVAPLIFMTCIVLLAVFQVLPALLLVGVTSFLTAVLRPVLLNRIQGQVSDDIRATIISMQSLMFTVIGAVSQPTLAYVADRAGLSVAYLVLVAVMSTAVGFLLWRSRGVFPIAEPTPAAA